jgi:hypothetical protein
MPPSIPLQRWSKTLLSERRSHSLITTVFSNALDLMLLGFTKDATRLLVELNKQNAFQFEGNYRLMRAMHFAWDGRSWPEFVERRDEAKPLYIYERVSGVGGTSKEFLAKLETDSREDWPQDLNEKYPDFDMSDLNNAISALNAQDPTGRERLNGKDFLACAIDIALGLGEEEQAEDLIRNHVVPAYSRLDMATESDEISSERSLRQEVAQSRRYWKSPISQVLAQEFEIDKEAVKCYVDEGISIIGSRLTKGPNFPFSEKPISELLQVMDENYIAARNANPSAGEHLTIDGFDVANIPPSFLRTGATKDEIQSLEEKLQRTLPEDYKEFLRISNGFYSQEPNDQTSIFYGIAGVESDDTINDCQVGVELLPYEYTSLKLMHEFEWPELHTAFSIGATGDEGSAWVIPREHIEKGLAEFERVYEKAEERDKRVYEKAALDLYGGVGKMREMEWLVITWAHWSPDAQPYGSFRAYLEHEVQYSIERRKQDEEAQRGVKRKRGDGSDDESSENESSGEERSEEDEAQEDSEQ